MNNRLLSILAFGAILVAGCNSNKEQQQSSVREELVETTAITHQQINRSLDISSTLQGYETINVSPSLTGKIEHIYVEVGSRVKQGDMLVLMDQSQYNTSKLSIANLGVELERMNALRETGAVSQQSLDQIQLSYDQTMTNIEFLEKNTFVKAPFSGVISAKNYEDGELYSGQPILVLTQLTTLKALVAVPENYFPKVHAGMQVSITSDIYPDEVFPAVVEIVYPTIDATSHTFQVKLKIPNSSQRLRPGMYVKTRMEMGMTDAFVVPYLSVLKMTGSNDRYVFIAQDGIAKRVFVKMGQRFDEYVEIISDGLHEGDKLVTLGQGRLVDGSKLKEVKEN